MTAGVTKPVVVYCAVTMVLVTIISVAAGAIGGTENPLIALFFIAAMWTPAAGRWVAQRFFDRDWKSPLPVRWTRPRLAHVGVPLLIALAIYAVAYATAAALGYTTWEPRWEGAGRIAANLAINIPIVVAVGFVGAFGEEIGWRGYLQPRLDGAGVRFAVIWVALIWSAFHLPAILFAGYQPSSQPVSQIGLFTLSCIADSLVWAWLCYRLKSVWPAVWFHTWHNFVSQWLFPAFFAKPTVELVLAEDGIFPTVAHLLAAGILLLWLRRTRITNPTNV